MELHLLRTFSRVMSEKSFTSAARALGVTQPAVSQQIAALETRLGSRLFHRAGHRLVPTEAAFGLDRLANDLLERVREYEERTRRKHEQAEGLVRYALPESCQWTPHFKWVMAALRDFPAIRVEVRVLANEAISEALLEGAVDFGFLVGDRPRPEFSYERFSQERYSAVAAQKDDFRGVPRFIRYPGSEAPLQAWLAGAQARERKALRAAAARPALDVGTLAGAIHALSAGAGMAVVATHCVEADLSRGALIEWPRRGIASNPIYLARRRGERPPHRVEVVLGLLARSKTELNR